MKKQILIDATKFSEELEKEFHGMISDSELKVYQVLQRIEAQPAVEAEVVTRCKECTWGGDNLICTNLRCTKSFYGTPVPPDHYCSYGIHK